MKIYESAVRKPISTVLIFLMVMILGIFSLSNLAIDMYPEMDMPTISVITTYEGANAADIETNVTRVLEDNLNTVDNLKDITSKSSDNFSLISLEFEWGTDLDVAANDIRDAIDRVSTFLPDEVDNPTLYKFSSSMIPVMVLSVTADKSYNGLYKLLDDQLVNRLNRVNGVGSVSMMGAPEGEEWKGAFRPLLPDVQAVEFNDFSELERITRRTACVLAEPVQGEAGVRPPRPGYLEALRRRCDEVGALLIFDEIQTGMGRTGRLFAMQKYGVTPDIVCLAKAFGGGMPLGAFVARHEVMDTLQENPALGHITTFGGHPVCCAAGLAALNYLVDNKVVERVETKGALYEMLLKDHPAVREIRRSGLLLAVELGESAKLYRIMELFREAGILSDWFLFCDTAFRISPPLTISEDEVRESAALIRSCLDRL